MMRTLVALAIATFVSAVPLADAGTMLAQSQTKHGAKRSMDEELNGDFAQLTEVVSGPSFAADLASEAVNNVVNNVNNGIW